MDPIAKAKMVALKGIKRVLAQDPMVVPPGINRYFLFWKRFNTYVSVFQKVIFSYVHGLNLTLISIQ